MQTKHKFSPAPPHFLPRWEGFEDAMGAGVFRYQMSTELTGPLVRRTATHFLLKTGLGMDYHYEIAVRRLATENHLTDWLAHLEVKRWFTEGHRERLVTLFREGRHEH